jgi:hypothetical protein
MQAELCRHCSDSSCSKIHSCNALLQLWLVRHNQLQQQQPVSTSTPSVQFLSSSSAICTAFRAAPAGSTAHGHTGSKSASKTAPNSQERFRACLDNQLASLGITLGQGHAPAANHSPSSYCRAYCNGTYTRAVLILPIHPSLSPTPALAAAAAAAHPS